MLPQHHEDLLQSLAEAPQAELPAVVSRVLAELSSPTESWTTTDSCAIDSFAATRRSGISLLAQMDYITTRWTPATPAEHALAADRRAHLSDILHRLDTSFTNFHKQEECRALVRKITSRPRAEYLAETFPGWVPTKARKPSELERRFLLGLRAIAQKTAKQRVMFQIRAEVCKAEADGWYTIFDSLTLKPGNYSAARNDAMVRKYLRDLRRSVGATLGYTAREADAEREDLVRYVCVPEVSKDGREHTHILMWLRALPRDASDPNRGRKVPYRRELTCMKRFWEGGWSSPKIVRTHAHDAWGKAGYVWHVQPVDNAYSGPLHFYRGPWMRAKPTPSHKVGNYLTKYLTKHYGEAKRWNRRISTNRTCGRTLLREALEALPLDRLLVLMENPAQANLYRRRVPKRMLMQETLRQIRKRLAVSDWRRLVTAVAPLPSALAHFRSLTRGTETLNPPRTTTSPTAMLLGLVASDDYLRLVREVRDHFRLTSLEHPAVREPCGGSLHH